MSVGNLSTPTGEATFTKLNTPDTSYGEPGSYTATIKLSQEGQEEVEAMLAPAIKKAALQLGVPAEELKLPTFTNKEGAFCVTGRLKAGVQTRKDTGEEFENRVKLLDASDAKLPLDTMIGKGSKLKFAGDLHAYDFTDKKGKRLVGISYRLKKVVVMKLVEVRTESKGSTVNF